MEPLTVSEFTRRIKIQLESAFPDVHIQGEVSNFKQQVNGHLYFSLKDQNAQISAVMFRGEAAKLSKLPKDGDQVVVIGEMNVYPPGGRYQIVAKELKQVGLGELLLKLEELKGKLHKLGWFSKSLKKPLPKFPGVIGVVTSPTGAVIQDIVNILTRRHSGVRLILYPVKVQGDGAAQEIAQAIDEMNRYKLVDVMIVGRGGGSIEDLWAFNEEIVAAAIHRSEIPIISAVGHETDHCIADYVADVRAPTPSAAAEIVIEGKEQQLKCLSDTKRQVSQTLLHLIRRNQERIKSLMRQPLFSSPYALLGPSIQKIDEMRSDIDLKMHYFLDMKTQLIKERKKLLFALKPLSQISQQRQQLNNLANRLGHSLQQLIALKKERLDNKTQTLQSINPKNLLAKGYSILFSEKKNSVITTIQDVDEQDNFIALLADGEFAAIVKHKKVK